MAFLAAASVLEVNPRTLAQSCVHNVVRDITELRSKHAEGSKNGVYWGIDGVDGKIADVRSKNIGALVIKNQTLRRR